MQDLANEIVTKLAADVQYFAAVIGLIGVLLGSVITIVGNLLLSCLQTRAERRRKVFEKELDRFIRLEELVGEITEWIGSYRDLHDPERIQRLDSLASEAGRFRRYLEVKQALRDLHNCALRLYDDRKTHQDDRTTRAELEEKYVAFLHACDSITGKRKL